MLWRNALDQKRTCFESSTNRHLFHPSEYHEFERYLLLMVARYERRPTARLLIKYKDTLGHIESFTAAITSMAQANEASTIVWGGLLGLLQVRVPEVGVLFMFAERLNVNSVQQGTIGILMESSSFLRK